MRLLIWHQFASNHSNDYAIVGKFETVEAAQHAYDEMHHILKTIADWCKAYRDQSGWHWTSYDLTPSEMAFAEQYGVKWMITLDTLKYGPAILSEMISCQDSHVLIAHPPHSEQTRSKFEPLAAILEQKGAQVLAEAEYLPQDLEVTVICHAPSDAVAQRIAQEAQAYFQSRDCRHPRGGAVPEPWSEYREGKRHPLADEITQLWEMRKSYVVVNQTIDDLYSPIEARMFKSLRPGFWGGPCVDAWGPSDDDEKLIENVFLDGLSLRFEDIMFGECIVRGLPAMIAWLKDQGCTDIKYTIVEDHWDE